MLVSSIMGGAPAAKCCYHNSSHILFLFIYPSSFLLLDLAVLSMQSSSLGSWFPVILVTVFNAGDMLGRIVSNVFLY